MSACQNCGGPLPPPKSPSPPRKWCSERCRKQALYSGTCIDCGGLTDGSNGRSNAPERCNRCRVIHWCASGQRVDMRHTHERALRIVAWWRDGLSRGEIAQRLGWSENRVGYELHALRAKGYDLPYRRQPKAVAA